MAVAANVNREEIVTALLRLKPALRERGVSGVAIFGSRARGDNRPDSDLDVLIDVQPNRKFSLLDLVGVSHVIGDELGIPANMFMRRSLEPQLAATIMRDIIEIFHD